MTTDLQVLWRERQEAAPRWTPSWWPTLTGPGQRFPDLDEAIREVRPTDPVGLAIRLRLLADAFAAGGHNGDEELALYIAGVLEENG